MCFSFHLNLPGFVSTPANGSFLWPLFLNVHVFWVGNYILLGIRCVTCDTFVWKAVFCYNKCNFFVHKIVSCKGSFLVGHNVGCFLMLWHKESRI